MNRSLQLAHYNKDEATKESLEKIEKVLIEKGRERGREQNEKMERISREKIEEKNYTCVIILIIILFIRNYFLFPNFL